MYPGSAETFNQLEAEITCVNCPKHLKRNLSYRKQLQKLKNKFELLKKRKQKLLEKNKRISMQLRRSKRVCKNLKNYNRECIIDKLPTINENSKKFAKMILRTKRSANYSDPERWISQCIYFRSSATYTFFRDVLGFKMPHVTSLHNWIQIKSLSPGFNENVLREIQKVVSKLDDKTKEVVLLFDEMSIQENLIFNTSRDCVDGFQDLGNGNRSNILATSVCVFMIRSLCGKFKQIINCVVSGNSLKSELLKLEIEKCLVVCQSIGLNVTATSCDQGSTNRTLYNNLGVSLE